MGGVSQDPDSRVPHLAGMSWDPAQHETCAQVPAASVSNNHRPGWWLAAGGLQGAALVKAEASRAASQEALGVSRGRL